MVGRKWPKDWVKLAWQEGEQVRVRDGLSQGRHERL